ncbi:mRNA decay activator protein ZFP36L1-like [Bombina bombina]|uniref:mRNA decay activator protein ZFP36L1-like n=1 Tax=Bombina bombina TaxID=8345 RepID=UPI00235AA12D|nr:mRNA decay activator protein ZFP36L1-like [Bombina bombina]
MPSSSLLSPFPELDTNLPKYFLPLLPEGSFEKILSEELYDTYSSCPISLNKDGKSQDQLADLTLWPLQSPWTRNTNLPPANLLRHIPFQAERSVSMIEESKQLQAECKLHSSRYKTELCRTFHESGSCKYGSKCQFAHGSGELRELNRHPKYKTELCRTYHTIGFCPYGSRCHFIHNADEQRFNGNPKSQRPHLLRQSMSCPGISSLSLSSSISPLALFSNSSSSSSFSPFLPSTPTFSPCEPLSNSGSTSPTNSPMTLSLSSLARTVSPPCPNLLTSSLTEVLLKLSPSKMGLRGHEKSIGCPSDVESEDSESKGFSSSHSNSQIAKRLPIFSRISD